MGLNREDEPFGVRQTSKGHVPFCMPCEYEGKPRPEKHSAAAAARAHRTSKQHRKVMRQPVAKMARS